MSREEVEKVHRDYLDTQYVYEYMRAVKSATWWWSRHLDFLIALGSAGGGAAGFVGMVAKMPELAWVCGPLTVVSAGLNVAKSVYGWGKSIDVANKAIGDYGKLVMQYRYLVDDLNAQKKWATDSRKKSDELRQTRLRVAPHDFPDLDITQQTKIQELIKKKNDRSGWWKP